MRRLLLLLPLLGCLVVVGAAASPSVKTSATRFRVTVYFLTDGQTAALGVRRTVVRQGSVAGTRLALEQLLAGPNRQEQREGLTSALPRAVSIRSFVIRQLPRGSTANVDLAGLPPVSRTSAVTVARIGTQIARTMIGLSDVKRVYIRANGRPWSFHLMSGGISTRPWDYDLLVGLWVDNFKALP